jgi:ribosome recycling factor
LTIIKIIKGNRGENMIDNEQVEEIILVLDDKLSKTISVLKEDYSAIRAGRANPHILDKVLVDYYGAMTPVSQTANISVQEGRCLVISPWDVSILKGIEKAIQVSNIGLTPTNDGKVIRLVFPDLTEERRRDLTKQTRKMGEDAKVAERNNRREAMDALKKLKNDKTISEDEFASFEKEVEKMVSDAVSQIDAVMSAKEKEIMTV